MSDVLEKGGNLNPGTHRDNIKRHREKINIYKPRRGD